MRWLRSPAAKDLRVLGFTVWFVTQTLCWGHRAGEKAGNAICRLSMIGSLFGSMYAVVDSFRLC
jgi:hypothetical protein